MPEATRLDDFVPVEERARNAATAGWEFLISTDERIAWCGPDGHGDLQLRRSEQGWTLTSGDQQIAGKMGLQAALTRATQYMERHPREAADE